MMDINCDMGEGLGNEAELMPFVDSVNIACGYHAGNADTMHQVVNLAIQHGVNMGAHPSFADRENFGRTNMNLPTADVYALVTDQLKALDVIVKGCGVKLHHVKPHGALYNMAAKDALLAHTIATAVRDFDPTLVFYGLSGSVMIEEAAKIGLQTAREAFADRTYQKDGSLTPRPEPNSMIQTVAELQQQVLQLISAGTVQAISGEEIVVEADTLCIHGDGPYALLFARAIRHLIPKK